MIRKIFISIIVLFISFTCSAQKIYEGNSYMESDVIMNYHNGYLYQGRSSLKSDIIIAFDGRYI